MIFRLPFDSKNPIGYLSAVVIEILMCLLLNIDCTCIWAFVLSVFLCAVTAAKDIKRSLKKISKSAKIEHNRSRIKQQLSESLQYYSRVERYERSNDKNRMIR